MILAALPGALAGALLLMTLAWALSLRLQDTSIVDAFWGPAFVAGAIGAGVAAQPPMSGLAPLLVGLVALWAFRLALHIGLRSRGQPEDPRYRAMREKRPETWNRRSLVTVFWLQAVLSVVIGLPIWLVVADADASIGWFAVAGTVLFVVGFVFETVADWQLQGFRRRGRGVMDKGLWRYSRHPNYFGETTLWWGIGLLGLEATHGWIGLLGPLVITVLLLRVSGVTLLEKGLTARRPGYAEYVERTSAFIPWPPKRG